MTTSWRWSSVDSESFFNSIRCDEAMGLIRTNIDTLDELKANESHIHHLRLQPFSLQDAFFCSKQKRNLLEGLTVTRIFGHDSLPRISFHIISTPRSFGVCRTLQCTVLFVRVSQDRDEEIEKCGSSQQRENRQGLQDINSTHQFFFSHAFNPSPNHRTGCFVQHGSCRFN